MNLQKTSQNNKHNLSNRMKNLLLCFVFIIFLAGSFFISPVSAAEEKVYSGRGEGQAEVNQRKAEYNGQTSKFVPLVGIPYVDTKDPNLSLPGYINALYIASISIAAFLAVIKIIFAGVQYMLSDVVTDKGQAKKDIRGALIGLLIVIGAVLILNTINPNLTGLRALDGPPVTVELELKKPTTCQQNPNSAFCRTAEGKDFIISPSAPKGECVTSYDVLQKDYTLDPKAGQVACGISLHYNQTTNTCVVIENHTISPDIILKYEERYKTTEEFVDFMNGWCPGVYKNTKYNSETKSCINR